MELKAVGYSEQILYAFSKLVELSFEKRKPHNPSLVAEIRVLISILKYDSEPEVDTITSILNYDKK